LAVVSLVHKNKSTGPVSSELYMFGDQRQGHSLKVEPSNTNPPTRAGKMSTQTYTCHYTHPQNPFVVKNCT